MAFERNNLIHDTTADKVIETPDKKFVRPEHLDLLMKFNGILASLADGNVLVYDKLADKFSSQHIDGIGLAGDMKKENYDLDGDGVIDVANTLKGLLVTVNALNSLAGIKSNVQTQLDFLSDNNMTQAKVTANVNTAISTIRDGVASDGDTLAKLRTMVVNLRGLIVSNDVNLDSIQEIVDYVKSNKTLIDNITTNKINTSDIVNDFIHTDINKPASANTVKILNDLLSTLSLSVSNQGVSIATLISAWGSKVDEEAGKGLSTEDFTTALKNKLENIYEVITTSNNLMIADSGNNFESTTKSLEYILAEIGSSLSAMKSKVSTILTMTKYSTTNVFSYDDFTEAFNISTIGGTLVNTVIDVINTSAIDVEYQMYAGVDLLYDGVIPSNRRISFDVQRQDLIIKLKGTGTIEINSKRIA